jgi:hypothetical protein
MSPNLIHMYQDAIITKPSPEYYSSNTFSFVSHNPESGVRWLNEIGTENAKCITKLRIWIDACYNFPSPRVQLPPNDDRAPIFALIASVFDTEPSGPGWCKFFNKIATDLTALKSLKVIWECAYYVGEFGGGTDVTVVRALGGIKGLETLKIGGCYAKEWPAYLAEKTGAMIVEEQHTQFEDKHRYMGHFRKHQQRNPDFVP